MLKQTKKSSKDKDKSSSSNEIVYDFDRPQFEATTQRWYYAGRRVADNKKAKKYLKEDEVARTPRGVDALTGRMAATSLNQQAYDEPDRQEYSYGTGEGVDEDYAQYDDNGSSYDQRSAEGSSLPNYKYGTVGQAFDHANTQAGIPQSTYQDALGDPALYQPTGQHPEQPKVESYDQGGMPQVHEGRKKGKGKDLATGNVDEIHTEYDENFTRHGTQLGEVGDEDIQSGSADAGMEFSYGGSLGGDDRHVRFGATTGEPIVYEEDEKEVFPDADADYAVAQVMINQDYYEPEMYNGGESSSTYAQLPGEAYQGEASKADWDDTTAYNGADHHIAAVKEEEPELDPRYKVERSNKFQPGEVFKTLWYEPKGSSGVGKQTDITETKILLDQHRNDYYVGFRRFIVVANDEGHCTCVPISTYERKACTKKGVKPRKHGIIYAQKSKPRLVKGEKGLGFEPICIQLMAKNESISPESRINYSKLVTIEHNVRVFFIGRIIKDDCAKLQTAVNQCWEEKYHTRYYK